MASDDLVVDRALTIPGHELQLRASRSGGPGGQHVNTSSTRIELVWDVSASEALSETVRDRLLTRLASRLDREGRLRLVSSATRSQLQNRIDVLDRLRSIVRSAMAEPRKRQRTKIPVASRKKRLESKRQRGALKASRRKPGVHDDR